MIIPSGFLLRTMPLRDAIKSGPPGNFKIEYQMSGFKWNTIKVNQNNVDIAQRIISCISGILPEIIPISIFQISIVLPYRTRFGRDSRNTKSTKIQITNKFKKTNYNARNRQVCNLDIVICSLFVIWCLEFVICMLTSLCGRYRGRGRRRCLRSVLKT